MSEQIATIRYPFWSPRMAGGEADLVRQVLDSNFLNDGEVTAEFECRIAALLECRHVVAVTSGTAALYLALMALGIGSGDEVIVPDVTFIATANAVAMTGATPVLADVEEGTLGLAPRAAEAAITRRTRAIIPVHVSGRAAALPALLDIANRYGLSVIEDAAEALLSKQAGRCLGTFGAAGCFSLSPNKTITTGQGGLIATNDGALFQRLRELKDQGRPVRGTGGADSHNTIGFNFKFTNLQAAVGLGQLDDLPRRVERLRAIYRRYADGLRDVPGIRLYGFSEEEIPQWIDARVADREAFDRYLLDHAAQCRAFWHPMHTHRPYRQPDAAFPIASRVVPESIWLPSSFDLTDEDVDAVCEIIRAHLWHGRLACENIRTGEAPVPR